MNAFRTLLIIFIVVIVGYTAIVISNHGANLIPVFFGDIMAMEWPGQFDLDFSMFLVLTGLWLAWRHHFKPVGILLGLIGTFGGMMFLAPYLLIASFKANGDMKELLLGATRANS